MPIGGLFQPMVIELIGCVMESKCRVPFNELHRICAELFSRAGMTRVDSELCSDALVTADAMGFSSHGSINALSYIQKADAGGVDFKANQTLEVDLPSIAVIDAHNALGIVSSCKAMNLACEKAEKNGIAIVSVKNSCHFGAAGYYANIAAKKGLFGLAFSNVNANMAAPGSIGAVLGNNPIAWAAPARSVPSVFLDIATSSTAALKVIQAKEAGLAIPEGWIVDASGMATEDPSEYPNKGTLLPMGLHKGYGLSLMVECLTGVLTGCGTSVDGTIPSWCFDLERPNAVSHTFIAINLTSMGQSGDYPDRVEKLMADLHNVPVVEGADSIRAPGERAWAQYYESIDNGVELDEKNVESLKQACTKARIAFRL